MSSGKEAASATGEMATAMVGTLTPFDSWTQTWEEYCEILDHFFKANGIADAGKKVGNIVELSRQSNVQFNEELAKSR